MLTRAAVLAAAVSLLSSPAFAGASQGRFRVGAVVVASATVTSSLDATSRDGVRVQHVAMRGTPAPMLLVANEVKPMTDSGAAHLAASATGETTVTVVY
jgi:hypothetical protein